MKVHSPSFKALEISWTVSFKRYFLGHFVDNSDIFTTAVLVQEETNLIRLILRQLFPFGASSLLIIFMNNFSARVRQKVQQRSVAVLASVRFLLLLCPRVDKQYVEADTSWELTHEMMSQLKKKQAKSLEVA